MTPKSMLSSGTVPALVAESTHCLEPLETTHTPLPGDCWDPQGLGYWLFSKTKTSGKVRILEPDACLQVPSMGEPLTHTPWIYL